MKTIWPAAVTMVSALALFLPGACAMAKETASIARMSCEYMTDPLGIDEPSPRLGWSVQSRERGWRQSAYRILAASSPELLAKDRGDLWDSGKVASDQNDQIAYQGKPLVSREAIWWKVRVWNGADQPSAWSQPAHWEMGLLDEPAWQNSRWIGRTVKEPEATADTLEGGAWIWYPEPDADPQKSAPAGTRYFRSTFDVPAGRKCRSARLAFTVDDAYDVRLNGDAITAGGHGEDWRSLKVADVTAHVRPGRNVLAIAASNDKDAAGLICRLVVEMDEGQPIIITSGAGWKSARQESPGWDRPDFDDSAWSQARVVAKLGEGPWGAIASPPPPAEPAPYLRRTCAVKGEIRRARLYACGLGYAELRLNGQKVGGDSERDPGYTDFSKRVLYVTHDVTRLLHEGENALGAILGDGWYDVTDLAVWNFERAPWHGLPRLRCVLALDYQDGHTQTIVSDGAWKASDGPILRDGIYSGEIYDARREMPGWDTAAFDDHAWEAAAVMPAPAGKLAARRCPPVAITRTLTPVAIKEPKPGVYIVDFGQNFSGHVRLKLKGVPGAKITLRYSEKVGKDGMIDRGNIDGLMVKTSPPQLFQTDTYICRGGASESWEQRFSYSGFRYVEVTGFPGKPSRTNFEGRFAHTALDSYGEFTCSDDMLNRLQQATRWSYLSNAQSIPTDCPQREKNGWTGDAHLAAETGLMNFHSAPFYTKWLDDFADNQLEDGRVGIIVPTGGWGRGDCHPAWDSAYPIVAWDLYRYLGDRRILARHFEHVCRYVDYLYGRTDNGVVPFDSLGDWVPWDTVTPSQLTSTAFLYHDARLVSDMARVLGKPDDERKYAGLADKVKQAYNARFWDAAKGTYANGSQTALSISLFFDLVPEERRAQVLAALVANVEKQGHIDAGILGAKYAIRVLTEAGRPDLAYHLITRKEQPGWGWWIEQGATTLWEDWKGEASLNHIMFGDISNWFFQWVAGIGLDPQSPGFRHILVRPQPLGLAWARASHYTPQGLVVSQWRNEGGTFRLQVSIPANASATVYVPAASETDVRESGKPAAQARGVRFVRQDGDRAVFEVGSGQYLFEAKAPASGK